MLPTTLEALYFEEDLNALFPGGFINFGYYSDINIAQMTQADRVISQKKLYHRVLSVLDICENEAVLEVGIGHGGGPAWTAENFKLRKMVGIDIFEQHVKLAERHFHDHLKKYPYLSYQTAIAENIPFSDSSFHKIYTVEAFQHFVNQKKFISEAFRLLQERGVFVIATFFLTDLNYRTFVEKEIPQIALFPSDASQENSILTVSQLQIALRNAGFQHIEIGSIGDSVWRGYHQWVSQTANNWDKGWLRAYEDNMLDYYVIRAVKK